MCRRLLRCRNISLEEVIFTADWATAEILPDNQPPFVDSSQDEIVDITSEVEPEKELELEKEKPAASRSRCLRSTTPGRARKKKQTKKCRLLVGRVCSGVCRGRVLDDYKEKANDCESRNG